MKRAFTLVELLVVAVVLAMLGALLQPVLSKAKRQAKISASLVYLKEAYTPLALYRQDWDGQESPGPAPQMGLPCFMTDLTPQYTPAVGAYGYRSSESDWDSEYWQIWPCKRFPYYSQADMDEWVRVANRHAYHAPLVGYTGGQVVEGPLTPKILGRIAWIDQEGSLRQVRGPGLQSTMSIFLDDRFFPLEN